MKLFVAGEEYEASYAASSLNFTGTFSNVEIEESGKFQISKVLSNYNSVVLHNYSITGLFEQKPVDMLKI